MQLERGDLERSSMLNLMKSRLCTLAMAPIWQ